MGTFSQAQAAVLVQLAAAAAYESNPGSLPAGFLMLQSFTSPGSIYPTVQGFYAQGTLPGVSGNVAVLALGVPWAGFANNWINGAPTLSSPPSWLNAPSGANVDDVVMLTYGNARTLVWNNLSFASGMPLYVTGMGIGGPVAQMAAADLRPGQTGPGTSQNAPTTAPVCYTFSTAAEGDAAYATFLASSNPSSFNVGLGSTILPVDLFPTAPGTAQGYTSGGTATPLAAPLATWDDPWLERGVAAYLTALGGTYSPPPPQPASISGAPAGFTQAQAYAMARLCTVVYQRAQHPGGLVSSVDPWTVLGNVTANGVPFCTLFVGPDAVVAAFRGTVTWQEWAAFQGNANAVDATYLNSRTAMVQGGIEQIATSPVTTGSQTTFRQSLAAQVQAVIGSRPLLLAGHDLGGALANLTASDLAINWPTLKPAAVYTFGAMPTGNYDYAQLFNGQFPGTSYQLLRPGDFAGNVNVGNQYEPLGTAVQLNGTPANDDPTQHPLAGYVGLLDPWAGNP